MMCTNNKRSTTARHQRKQSQTARRTVRWRGQASERASKEERTSRCAAFCSPPDHRANLNRSLGSGPAQGSGSVRSPWLPRGREGFIVRFVVCRLSGYVPERSVNLTRSSDGMRYYRRRSYTPAATPHIGRLPPAVVEEWLGLDKQSSRVASSRSRSRRIPDRREPSQAGQAR